MALGARELRLILSIQSYGTSNFSKVRRDIENLERTTRAANLNQLAVQAEMVRKAQQLEQVRTRIASTEAANIAKVSALRTKALNAELAYREKITKAAVAADAAVVNKRQQIARTAGTLGVMQGSGMGKFGVAESRLVTQRVNLANKIGAIERSGMGLEAQRLRNLATQVGLEQRLTSVSGARRAQEIMNAKQIEKFKLGPVEQQLAYRYHAARIEAEKIVKAQAAIPREIGAVQSQLATVARQEELITQQKTEQAATIGRQAELLRVQQTQLVQIEERQAEIAAEVARIQQQEALITPEIDAQIQALMTEDAQLTKLKISAGELAAEFKRLGTIQLQNAAAADAAVVKQNRLLGRQTGARTAAHIGRTAQFTGLLGVAGLGLMAQQFATFNVEAAKAATQMRGVRESFVSAQGTTERLQNDIIGMTKEFPASAHEMANSAYEIASGMDFAGNSTQRLAQTERLLRAANQVAIAGQTDLASATDVVITAFNNFDPSASNVQGTLNKLFAIVRFGKGDFTQFASVFGRVASAAHASGASLQEAGGALAYLSTVLPRTAATAGLARLYQILSRKEFVAGMKALGIPITVRVNGVDKLKPLSQIIGDIVKAAPKLREGGLALRNFIPAITSKGQQALGQKGGVGLQGTQQATVVLTDLIKGYPQYRDVLRNIARDNNEFTLSLKQIRQTPGFQWQLAIAQFKAFAIVLGQAVLPVLARVVDWISNLIKRFQNLSPHTRKIIGEVAAFGAVALLVVGTLTALLGSLAGLAFALGALTPIFLAVATAATTAAVLIVKNWNTVSVWFEIFTKNTPLAFERMWDYIKAGAEGAAALVLYPFKEIIAGFSHLPNIVLRAMGTSKKELKDAAKTLGAVSHAATANLHHAQQLGQQMRDNKHDIILQNKLNQQGAAYAQAYAKATGHQANATSNFSKELQKKLKQFKDDATATALLKYLQDFQTQGTNKNTVSTRKAADATHALANARLRLQSATLRVQQAEQAATQQLQTAFGGLGQGPLAGGPIGQIFQNINSTISGFGGKPIALPVQLILGDQAAQQRNFDTLTKDLTFFQNRLTKAKLPKVFVQMQVQSLLEQGTAALPLLEGIKHMTPGQLKNYLERLRKEAKSIEKAKDSPFEKELTAANIQLHAAKIQLAIAQGNVKAAKTRSTHQVHYHGDTYNLPAGMSKAEFIKILRRRDIANRNKGTKK